MKIKLPVLTALASRAYPDDDLSTLRSQVPNANFANFNPSDGMHYDSQRHPNNDGQGILKPTISRRKKKLSKKRAKYKKDQRKLAIEIEKQKEPKENNSPTDRSQSNSLPSAMGIGDAVVLKLQFAKLISRVLAVTFMNGKVLYTLAVYTGDTDGTELAGQYGQINTIGWDDDGRCYIRLPNVESTLVEPEGGWPPAQLKAARPVDPQCDPQPAEEPVESPITLKAN